MENNNNGLRMYFFCLRQLSGLDKGIQAGHAALEYANLFRDDTTYNTFVNDHKTFILLNGGGSDDIMDREVELREFNIPFASFIEPSLNYATSAIAFIVPESIYGMTPNTPSWFDGYSRDKKDYEIAAWLKSFRLASN